MKAYPLAFGSEAYQNPFLDLKAQRCVNLYPKGESINGTPGSTLWTTVGDGPIRALAPDLSNNVVLVVSGNTVYTVAADKGITTVGNMPTGPSTGPIGFATDGTNALISQIGGSYTPNTVAYNGGSLSEPSGIVDNVGQVAYSDGFYLAIDTENGVFYKSTNVNDPTAWGSEFATPEQNPDDLLGILVSRANVWLFGEVTSEVWIYSAEEEFPFSPNRSAFQQIGIAAPSSAIALDNHVAWLARSAAVDCQAVIMDGFEPTVVSTPVLEREWGRYSRIDDALSFSYHICGSGLFWVLVFPSQDKSFVYDLSEKKWHEWERFEPPFHGRYRANCHYMFNGLHLVGDYANGNIYVLDDQVYTDNGAIIRREAMSKHLFESRRKVFHHGVELMVKTGSTELSTGQGSDPLVYLQYSDDRGNNWSNKKQGGMGKLGEYDKRVKFRRLGASRDRIYRITMSEPIETRLSTGILSADFGSA